jgi:hypothetical protein
MDSRFFSQQRDAHPSGGHEQAPLGLQGQAQVFSAETIRHALRRAVREIFPSIIVDLFQLQPTAAPFVAITMQFRAPMSYSEVANAEDLSSGSAAASETAMVIESQVGLTLIDLFGFVHLDEVSISLNARDQVVCTIAARVPARVAGSLDDD